MRPLRAFGDRAVAMLAWSVGKMLRPMTRAEGVGFYAAVIAIGVLAITHFTEEGRQRRHQTEAIQRQAGAIQVQALSIKAHAEEQSSANRRQSEAIVATNRQSHYDDCVTANAVRRGLRENVIQGEKTLPLFLKLLPQFNTAEVLAINRESVSRQLRDFAARNCKAYAEQVVPPGERPKFKHVPLIKPPRRLDAVR